MNKKNTEIKFNPKKVGFCRFKKLGNKYLVTNDIGRYVFLPTNLFKQFMEGTLDKSSKIYEELERNEFIRDALDLNNLVEKYRQRNAFLFHGPSLHIVVVTLRCNQKCIYCQASSRDPKEKSYDMDIKTARKVVDTIFCSPGKPITIEFQGGEPLVNWLVVKFIIEYARKKNETANKELFMTLVSNFTLMTEEKYKFLVKNQVSICTSLDGPEELHNKNRPWSGGNSYKITTEWTKKMVSRQEKDPSLYHVNALVTISKFSLKYVKEIVDEYVKLDLAGIFLRPLSFLGLSGKLKETIGYSVKEFMNFWEEAMDYIIKLNLRGKLFIERGSVIRLRKILTDQPCNFADLRSPCGAGIGQILYNYDGKVYTCDEGRMIGDDTFKIGDINQNNYKEIVSHDTVKSMGVASLLESLPCDSCVYKPYCGVCPVLNYALYGNLFPELPNNNWCKLQTKIFDYLFKKLENKDVREIFEKWIK